MVQRSSGRLQGLSHRAESYNGWYSGEKAGFWQEFASKLRASVPKPPGIEKPANPKLALKSEPSPGADTKEHSTPFPQF